MAYITNDELYEELKKSKEQNELTKKAVELFMLLSKKFTDSLPFNDEFLREEACSQATMDLIMYWRSFKPDEYTNAFAYFTQITKNGSAKGFNKAYKFGKKFKGKIIRLSGGRSTDDGEIYTM